MDHSVLTILDLGIITAYLVIMVLVGVYSVRRIQNTKDYYVAGRSFGPMVLMATVCATIIGGSGLMGRAGVAYTDGFKAVLTAIPYLLGMFIFSGIAGKISDIGMQYGITSIPELFERRFGRAAKITLSVLIAFAMMGTVASQVTATATIIRMLGGEFGADRNSGLYGLHSHLRPVRRGIHRRAAILYADRLRVYPDPGGGPVQRGRLCELCGQPGPGAGGAAY